MAIRSGLKGKVEITDQGGELLYSASWRPAFPTAIWTLRDGSKDVATLRRKALATLRTCVVMCDDYEFTLRRRLSFSRRTQVHSGPFDGATLSGSLTGADFRLVHKGVLIAEAEAQMLSGSRHAIRLIDTENPQAETLTALMMVDLAIQKHEEF
jgi:hypothetical protein